jgi:hypothetical protein
MERVPKSGADKRCVHTEEPMTVQTQCLVEVLRCAGREVASLPAFLFKSEQEASLASELNNVKELLVRAASLFSQTGVTVPQWVLRSSSRTTAYDPLETMPLQTAPADVTRHPESGIRSTTVEPGGAVRVRSAPTAENTKAARIQESVDA